MTDQTALQRIVGDADRAEDILDDLEGGPEPGHRIALTLYPDAEALPAVREELRELIDDGDT